MGRAGNTIVNGAGRKRTPSQKVKENAEVQAKKAKPNTSKKTPAKETVAENAGTPAAQTAATTATAAAATNAPAAGNHPATVSAQIVVGGTSPVTDNTSISVPQEVSPEQSNTTNFESKYASMVGSTGTLKSRADWRLSEKHTVPNLGEASRWVATLTPNPAKEHGQKSDEKPSPADELSGLKSGQIDIERRLDTVERTLKTKIDAEAMGELVLDNISGTKAILPEIGRDMDNQNKKLQKVEKEIEVTSKLSNAASEIVQRIDKELGKRIATLTDVVSHPSKGLATLTKSNTETIQTLSTTVQNHGVVLGGYQKLETAIMHPSEGLAARIEINNKNIEKHGTELVGFKSTIDTLKASTSTMGKAIDKIDDALELTKNKVENHDKRLATLEKNQPDCETAKRKLEDSEKNAKTSKHYLDEALKLVSAAEVLGAAEKVKPLLEIVTPLLADGHLATLTESLPALKDLLKPETVTMIATLNPMLPLLQKLVEAAGVKQTGKFLASSAALFEGKEGQQGHPNITGD